MLYAQGRKLEVRLVVGTRYEIAPGEALFPGVRVVNGLDGGTALTCEGIGAQYSDIHR